MWSSIITLFAMYFFLWHYSPYLNFFLSVFSNLRSYESKSREEGKNMKMRIKDDTVRTKNNVPEWGDVMEQKK
jgi:hypothetical protein